jgi:hypothetical protein
MDGGRLKSTAETEASGWSQAITLRRAKLDAYNMSDLMEEFLRCFLWNDGIVGKDYGRKRTPTKLVHDLIYTFVTLLSCTADIWHGSADLVVVIASDYFDFLFVSRILGKD